LASNTTSWKTRLSNYFEKADNFIERYRRYLRPLTWVIFFVLVGLAIEYLFLTIAAIYVLANSIGAQNLQLVILSISAMSALASASAAFLVYRNSVRGADITVAIENLFDQEMEYQIRRNPLAQVPAGTTQELFEKLHFEFPVVWVNVGPSGGAITNVELRLVKPISLYATVRDGESSEDEISVLWQMYLVKPEERITLDSVKLPMFSSGSKNPIPIGDHESVAFIAKVDLLIMDKKKDARPPLNSWLKIQRDTQEFEFKVRWKTATKNRLETNERSFRMRPKLGAPIRDVPGVTVS
jgi:hypothetical protein